MSSSLPVACYVMCFWKNVFFTSYCLLLAHVAKRANSRLQIFFKTGALKNFAMFIGKFLCWSRFLIKFQYWRAAFLFKNRLQHSCFYVNIAKFLRTAFLQKTCSLYLSEILFDDILELNFTAVTFAFTKICK